MDELDLKILRSLISERAVSPSNASVNLSLRGIAARLGADDMTVRYRYKRLQESGCMSVWSLLVNPTFFGYKVTDLMVDVQPESGKPDMIRKTQVGPRNHWNGQFLWYGIEDFHDIQWRRIAFSDDRTNLSDHKCRKSHPVPNASTKERD